MTAFAIKQWLKPAYLVIRRWQVPPVSLIYRPLHWLLLSLRLAGAGIMRVLIWTPMFRSQVTGGEGLYLYDGLPQLLGPVKVTLGQDCRISGVSTICGRPGSVLELGDNIDIGWQNTIACGTRITLGNNVRLAGRVFLAGYPGHPIEARARAKGLPERPHQARAITLHQDVWVGTGAIILAGVTIGRGSIVAAGAVVSRDVPAGVVVAGNPARVVRNLEAADEA
ncbi:transferase hexapeptide (six repeat-containing protein) [Ferrimonas sediminum]|uniref:Transferase hexapeptide (Six repeat-containing protein) n=1 Tax=Ferrimonas sediminum TaxID=718193 RepID=A0A1G8S680_9GAMM|nr:acyltransferase [Ferrimonas sediminum]SDJ24683.1 transferase hexapeptide (six repeat-containing protein) [Ferrimonas sediminum]